MTTMKKIKLADATPAQLRHYAGTVLALEVSPSHNGPQLIAKINQADPTVVEIEVEDVPDKVAPETITNVVKPAALGDTLSTHVSDDPKVTLMIQSTQGKGGDRDVQVTHNGDTFLIKRDVEAIVPYRVLVALRAAIEQDISQTTATPGMPAQIVVRNVLAYPLQVLEGPTKAEIAAWEKRMERVELGEPVRAAA